LTFNHNLDNVKLKQCDAKRLDQRSLSSQVTVQTHAHRADCSAWTTEWSVKTFYTRRIRTQGNKTLLLIMTMLTLRRVRKKLLTSSFSMTCLPKEQILVDIVKVMLHELSNLQRKK